MIHNGKWQNQRMQLTEDRGHRVSVKAGSVAAVPGY